MRGQDILFSHENDDWGTPDYIFNPLNLEVNGFGLDVAATEKNAKCFAYLSKLDNALKHPNWNERSQGHPCWNNPPYSLIAEFMQKSKEESLKGATVYCLIPIRSDTPWWHRYVLGWDENGEYIGGATEIRYIVSRIRFQKEIPQQMTRYDFSEKRKKYQYSAPFPSVIVIYRPGTPKYLKTGKSLMLDKLKKPSETICATKWQ